MNKAVCFLSLCLLFGGCARQPVEQVEWTTMGTIASFKIRGEEFQRLCRLRRDVQCWYDAVIKEFDIHSTNSQINLYGRCSSFGRPCESAAARLKEQSGGAFDPEWRGKGKPDYGAIAKGYAVDCAATHIRNDVDILLDLGGNLKSVRGSWKVGIAGSDRTLTLTNGMACATSAEYFRGKHIYDGRTGNAVTNDIQSVTVVHPTSAMLADGLSTTLFVLGREEGEKFLKVYYPEARAIWEMK